MLHTQRIVGVHSAPLLHSCADLFMRPAVTPQPVSPQQRDKNMHPLDAVLHQRLGTWPISYDKYRQIMKLECSSHVGKTLPMLVSFTSSTTPAAIQFGKTSCRGQAVFCSNSFISFCHLTPRCASMGKCCHRQNRSSNSPLRVWSSSSHVCSPHIHVYCRMLHILGPS